MKSRNVTVDGGGIIVDTGLPQRSIKPLYLQMHVDQRFLLSNALADPKNMVNGVVRLMCLNMIYSVLDVGRREMALQELQERTDNQIAELENQGSLDYDTRMETKSEIALEITQNVTDYLDTAFGVSHGIAIGTTGGAPNDDDIEHELEPDSELEMSDDE